MTDLMRYAAELEGAGEKGLPPVEKWNPEYCGEIDLVIKRDGTWVHEGTPIGRARLVRLFSTVLRREGDGFFLVTPVEKMQIDVEDAPFVAVLMRREGEGETQRLIFTTNLGDEAVAGPNHPLDFREDPEAGERAPYIDVRAGLEARIARAVYYDLVALGEPREIDGEEMFGVWSDGVFFPFGPADEIYE
ncbi:DUF1285 domain-containing protein [Hyphococcus sp.]|uniref:DUF1285 domain-containing protein n=1 Tax=Hyphococcus sp. TaxID=2038636 RepID=UPI0035C67A8A